MKKGTQAQREREREEWMIPSPRALDILLRGDIVIAAKLALEPRRKSKQVIDIV